MGLPTWSSVHSSRDEISPKSRSIGAREAGDTADNLIGRNSVSAPAMVNAVPSTKGLVTYSGQVVLATDLTMKNPSAKAPEMRLGADVRGGLGAASGFV